mmetsp:Transcript_63422/g.178487  ORF Transcript_63422/g.178487 Transcript_63422/m.178487 type:complete len:273 (+) Transcript_63422:89-907(+)
MSAALRETLLALGLLSLQAAAFVPGGVALPPHARLPPASPSMSAASGFSTRIGSIFVGGRARAGAPPPRPASTNELSRPASAGALRSITLTNCRGVPVSLGGEMGNRTSIVVFLKHFASPSSWDYAKSWCVLRKEADANTKQDVAGPIFIGFGDKGMLRSFLDWSPHLDRDQTFMDGFDLKAYEAAGVKTIVDDEDQLLQAQRELQGFRYMLRVPQELKRGTHTDLDWMQLGATFVVSGDEILYRSTDTYAKRTNLREVWDLAAGAAAARAA